MDLFDYGFTTAMQNPGSAGIPARVTAVHRERYALVCDAGECYGRLKSSEYYAGRESFPTTGDFVMIDYIEFGDSRIISTLPRKTYFSRRDPTPGRGEQAVAANFDCVFIMQSLNHDFNPHRLERYLSLAWQSGAVPAVILTKADLLTDCAEYVGRAEKLANGAAVIAVSAKDGIGLDALSGYLKPRRTAVFLGSSGVGKSSLVNALAGYEIMPVNEIREDDSRGRHTTTHRQLIMLPNGAMIIDTPGMRELGMWDADSGISEEFDDVERYIGKCRYSDCSHRGEPGCAIKEAIESGELSLERYDSYTALKSEAKFSDNKKQYLREKTEKFKAIAKYNKSNGKTKY